MKRILVIRLGALGDIVLATAAVEALARAHPRAAIEFLCKDRFAGILEGSPRLAAIRRFNERGVHRGMRGLLLFLRELQDESYDLLVDLQATPRSAFLTMGIRAGKKVRWHKRALQRRMMLYGRHERQPADRVLDRYLQAVAPFAPSAGGSRPRLFASTETAIPAVPAEPFIAIAPGAHWSTKRWPVEHFQALVAALSKRGLSIVLVGNADDRQACDAIASAATGIVNRAGMLDLAQLKAVVARSRMAITNDTGVMHIAEALGKPVAALFGPTVPQFGFAPWRPESVLIEQDLDCRPCSLHGSKTCPRGHFQCMRGIVPQVVLEAVNALLAP